MRVVTVATHSERYYPILQKSCEDRGVNLEVLGWGLRWQGLTWKLKLMNEYIQTLDDNEIVMFIDGFDTIILQDLSYIETCFRSCDTSIVFSSEKENPSTIGAYIQRKMFGPVRGNIYINTGMYVGYAHALKQLYKHLHDELIHQPSANDQRLVAQLLRSGKIPSFKLDTDNKLFLNILDFNFMDKNIRLHNNEFVRISPNNNGKLLNKINDFTPCVLQAPARTNIMELLKYLNYDTLLVDKGNPKTSMWFIMGTMKGFMEELILEIIICLIILILIVYLLYQAYKYTMSSLFSSSIPTGVAG